MKLEEAWSLFILFAVLGTPILLGYTAAGGWGVAGGAALTALVAGGLLRATRRYRGPTR